MRPPQETRSKSLLGTQGGDYSSPREQKNLENRAGMSRGALLQWPNTAGQDYLGNLG